MKQPVWILNSSLLVLFFISQLLLFMLQKAVPRRISISPGKMVVVEDEAVISVDIAKIYEQDLFNTYEAPVVPTQSVVDETVAAMPKPPKIIVPDVPVEKTPTFFAPLDVILKGVVFVRDDPKNCIAIVQAKKTKEERNYQIGDLIEDAQILKILSNRIIIIRSNGQQETLYLREEDAISDFNTEAQFTTKLVVERSFDDKYIVNMDEFSNRVHNLGEFINILNLTTVYKQGKSFGCRIGKVDKESLGSLLGFMVDDIIVKIDGSYIDDLASRIKVYDHVMQKHAGETIDVVLHRGNDLLTLMYGLVDSISKTVSFPPQQSHEKLENELKKHEEDEVVDHNNSDEDSVKIQNLSQEIMNEIIETSKKDETSSIEANVNKGFDINSTTVSKDSFKPQSKDIAFVDSINSQTLNELDMHKKRLVEEREKLMPTLQDMKFKDRNNMMKRSSKNVIFNGMQQ